MRLPFGAIYAVILPLLKKGCHAENGYLQPGAGRLYFFRHVQHKIKEKVGANVHTDFYC